MTKNEEGQWYSNKELYEMMVALSKKIEELGSDLGKTQVLIRDYNGLREKIEACEQKLAQSAGGKEGSKDMWGYIVGGIGLLMALISYAVR